MIRVVVADDENKVCQLICQLIDWEGLGMSLVGTASNGVEALDLIEKKRPDLVLTDIRMPGYDGMELLRRAREIEPNLEFIIISGYSHFEYAQTAIRYGVSDYILKPINKELLNATLQKVRQRYLKNQDQAEFERITKEQQAADQARLRETFWPDLRSGEVAGDREEINQTYYFHFGEGTYQIFLIQADMKREAAPAESLVENVMEFLYEKAQRLMDKMLRPLCIDCEIFCKAENSVGGVLNYPSHRRQEVSGTLEAFINRLCVELHAFNHMRFRLSVSEASEDIESLPDCLGQAELAMGQRLFLPKTVYLTEVPKLSDFDEDIFYKPFSAAVRRSFDMQDFNEIEEAVKELAENVGKENLKGCQILGLVKNCYRLFLLSSVFQKEYHFTDRDALQASFDRNVVLCSELVQVYDFLMETCKKNLEDACSWLNREKMRPISQAKQYIREHYAEPLSLEDVSSQVGFSGSYFSTLFRKETGKTFLEYLMEVRIEEAKTLLRESRMTIENVCREVGYNDYKRFSKLFKKATGISPKEYRNLYS